MPSFLFLRAAIYLVLSTQVKAIPSLGKRRATQLRILEERSVLFRKPRQVLEKKQTKQNQQTNKKKHMLVGSQFAFPMLSFLERYRNLGSYIWLPGQMMCQIM